MMDENFDFLLKFVDWGELSRAGNIPNNILLKYKSQVYWNIVVFKQYISEEILDECSEWFDSIDWNAISGCAKLSESFIKKHIKNLDVSLLMSNLSISNETKEDLKNLMEII